MLWLQFISILFILQSVRTAHHEKEPNFDKTNYCILKCGKDHIACNNSGKPGPQCPANVKAIHMDHAIRNLILSIHNEKRDEVAGGIFNKLPTAARMGVMQWDYELAHLAKLKALQCTTSQDHCHSTSKYEHPGQSVALLEYKNETEKFSVKTLVENRIDAWFSVSSAMKANNIYKYHDNKHPPYLGRFALVIMDKNIHIGCGAVHFESNSKQSFHLVCNYAYKPQTGHALYKPGNAASECTSGKAKNYRHLCSSKEQY